MIPATLVTIVSVADDWPIPSSTQIWQLFSVDAATCA